MRFRKKKLPTRIIRITRDYETPKPLKIVGKKDVPKRMQIIEVLRDHPEGLFRAEIARRTGYRKSHFAACILINMVRDEVLIKENGKYYLNTVGPYWEPKRKEGL